MDQFTIFGCFIFILRSCSGTQLEEDYLKFPPGFSIGSASSAYQVEGAWNVSGKTPSVWDWFTHKKDSTVMDQATGDIACDSYHKYKEDIAMMKDIGFRHYRFSLSWTRILPTGFPDKISQEGLQYYKDLIDEVRRQGMEPFVTIYHWDHPEFMNRLGSWTNELMVEYYAEYARIVFRELGSRVKVWATLNEPEQNCRLGFAKDVHAPGINLPYFGEYLCLHNYLKAHARAYQIYNEEFRAEQGGQVGIVHLCEHFFPQPSHDLETSRIGFECGCGWATHPIFSKEGNYPQVMRERVNGNSKLEGLPFSRLPKFSPDWIKRIRGSSDFLGINVYTAREVRAMPREKNGIWPNDFGTELIINETWPVNTAWLRVIPQALGEILRRIRDVYDNPPVYIMENGATSAKGVNDYNRIEYLHDYMKEMLLAINRDGCNVKGYTIWSFLDSFEWSEGYTDLFGLVEVDFTDPNRKRTPRLSTKWLKKIMQKGRLINIKDLGQLN
ncbi:myrosinase 1-like [Diachasmimorpha longicaudata]|uniref:myrosinase 1-like n=1 Tax=Diachasmimorpha longicaudata TaxID=58733 RepID=UPI0030B8EAC4